MRRKWMTVLCAAAMSVCVTACAAQADSAESTQESQAAEATEEAKETQQAQETAAASLEDGTYQAEFHTDSGMFHVNEAKDGKGELTVADGKMTIHISLASKNIINLFVGTAEDAQKDGAEVLEPTTDTVTYSDGMSEEVYGFDLPVPAIDEEFDVALIGTKGNWYDHKVTVSNPQKAEDSIAKGEAGSTLADGTYTPDDFTWSGGSGRVEISCGEIRVEGGQAYATISFNSSYYSSVKVGDTSYDGLQTEDVSQFEIPVTLNEENTILGTTTRMSTAHEIEYKICPYLAAAGGEDAAKAKEDTKSEELEEKSDSVETAAAAKEISYTPPELPGLTFESKLALTYAEGFDVFYYSDGYALLNVYDSAQYLVVPEGKKAPEGLDAQIKVLQKPLDHIYLAATSAMSLFRAMDALDYIRLTGTDASGWYIDEAKEALDKGDMLFAGKYSEPDYELMVNEGCNLAIESTMILHSPKVQEMIEGLGIPVLIDRSSYETHPLGRTEWIKLYGVLTDTEDVAESFFEEQSSVIGKLKDFKNTEKTVAFFYVDTDGTVVVRKSDDYIPSMIELAGGRYIFSDLTEEDSKSSSMKLTMEEFYATAMDADYLIYNGTIDNPLDNVEELLEKNELFADFKAVKDGNVWTIGKDLYQSTDTVGELILDIHQMLAGDASAPMTFLEKVK